MSNVEVMYSVYLKRTERSDINSASGGSIFNLQFRLVRVKRYGCNKMADENLKLVTTLWEVRDLQSLPLDDGQVAIWWVGQSGFAVRAGSHSFLIDPYLSDSLAKKYKGKPLPHKRMLSIPVDPAALKNIDWVFSTHRHTDHMDPETIRALARNPRCHFFVPCAALNQAVAHQGLELKKTTCVNAGQSLTLDTDFSLNPIPAAHEQLVVNSRGEHHFLGYIFRLGDIQIYHSGDCVPYDGLEDHLRNLKPDVAMLPVNGRDAYRLNQNIAGNFHFEEALQLCLDCEIPYMIPHHFGMFDFNTIDPLDLQAKIKKIPGPVRVILPEINMAYCFSN
jgi:L-ascorbate metabolism protein UlaG (beta-lactamase superfamily)